MPTSRTASGGNENRSRTAWRHLLDRSLRGESCRRPFDRDRIGADQGLHATRGDRGALPMYAPLHDAVGRLEEVIAVELGVEAEDGAAEQAVDDLFAPGTNAEGLGVWPGDVPEGNDGRLRQSLPYHAGQKSEMVVLHKHDRVVLGRLLHHGVGEALIHGDIVLPVALAENRPDESDMA